ncbi:MAG TPA: trigger factor [Chthoniobacterales bacterium]|nr:trigger factor [Chthoniobacterales bacterium]
MKVEVENQPHCVATLKIELPPEQVSKEWDAIANSFAAQARIPGYRPGKAPKRVIEAKFRKDIQEELTKKLVSKSYHEAIAEKQLRVVSLTNLEDVEFGDDRSMRFRATVVTAPEFELPDYKGIPLQLPETKVSEEEIDAAVERLREQSADFVDVPERGLEMEDFAVIDFEGTIAGTPIAELAPNASRNLQGGKKFWLRLSAENFLPGFVEQMIGQKPGETRTIKVEFPADFPVAEVAGKTAEYQVTLQEIKQRVLPPLDDVFAAKWMPEKTLADLRQALEHQIEHEKGHELERARERQVVQFLSERVQFELPPNLLKQETRNTLAELVQRNRERGVADEALKEKEEELIRMAGGLAAHRLKTNFILHRIAEQEKIQVTRADLDETIRHQAMHHNITPEKMRQEIEKNDGMNGLVEQVLLGKTIDFLGSNATIESAPATPVSEQTNESK